MADPLQILYQDDVLVAIHKPAGLLVHRSDIARGQDTTYALQLVRDQIGQYVYPLHRLDRPTSGVLLFGLDEDVTRILKEDFSAHRIEKRYVALVRGWVEVAGTVDYPLKKTIYDKRKKVGAAELPRQEAITDFEPLARSELPIQVGRYATARYTLVHLFPKTGRTHQLRRHMAHLRHPIIGDRRYGDNQHNRMFTEELELPRLFLTAITLSFQHPLTKENITIKTSLESDWHQLFEKLEIVPGPLWL